MTQVPNNHDVVILGSGIAGTMLGSILAKHGLKVLLIDAGSHPRFAIGEATTPDTSALFKLLGLRHELPEIGNLATFYDLRDKVGPSSGVKRAFTFLYQREGQKQELKESHQFPTLTPPLGPDCHFFRQDTDAYMLSVALKYGATVRQQTRIRDIEFEEDKVILTSDKEEVFQCRYIVDGAGFRSPLAKKFDLRGDPSEMLASNTRAIFTHMIDVKLYDQIAPPISEYGLKTPFSQGTLHHVFEGGWFWIIPFNNHLDYTNKLCSVGLVLNRDIHPETGMDAEEEFFSFVNRFPDMAKQFEEAKAARNWVSTGKIQYAAKHITGHRYMLLPHAATFIDPLFSPGLNLTIRAIDQLSTQLKKSFQADDFSVAQFEHINDSLQENVKQYDLYISRALESFKDYDLWDAWYRVWVAANFVGTAVNTNRYFNYIASQDKAILNGNDDIFKGVLGSTFPPHRKLFDKALVEMDAVKNKEKSSTEAAKNIRALFDDTQYIPSYYQWGNSKVRSTPTFTFWQAIKLHTWYLWNAPKEIRKKLFGWNLIKAGLYVMKSIRQRSSSSHQRKRLYRRDVFRGWNNDWQKI